jgi:hypothetical protein
MLTLVSLFDVRICIRSREAKKTHGSGTLAFIVTEPLVEERNQRIVVRVFIIYPHTS